MGKYSSGFDEAERLADDELTGKLLAFDWDEKVLRDLAIEQGDDEKIDTFIASMKESANAEQAKKAWINFAGRASLALVRAFRKVVLP